MGVTGIWDHMQKYAEMIDVAQLKNTVLAIDGHIWLFESTKGCQTYGVTTSSTFLVTFYNRCRRLREHGIEPIIVFDNISYASPNQSQVLVDNIRRKRSKRFGGGGWTLENCAHITEKITKIQALLEAMGVPCIFAGSEGEAQCAQLEKVGIVNGCATSDFDYFLFGGLNLYKIEFSNGGRSINPNVTHYSMHVFEKTLSLNRNRLITLAMLLGCDYLEGGVGGVGIVTALEILSEFTIHEDDHIISILDRFSSYCKQELPLRESDSPVKVKFRSNKFKIPYGFPNTEEYCEAASIYLLPCVIDYQRSSIPLPRDLNFKIVANLLLKECNWSASKFDKEISRSQRLELSIRKSLMQSRVTEYFVSSKRRGSSKIEETYVEEERPKCSQREYAALESLRKRASLYDVISELPKPLPKRIGGPIEASASPAKRSSPIIVSDTTPTTSTQQQNLQACEDGETFSAGASVILIQ
ncbi:unnamed protein product [Auanema sp. JU1783]|nr:unnamed protein product [Auanema sp. JU1783]